MSCPVAFQWLSNRSSKGSIINHVLPQTPTCPVLLHSRGCHNNPRVPQTPICPVLLHSSGCLTAVVFLREALNEGGVKKRNVLGYFVHRYIRWVVWRRTALFITTSEYWQRMYWATLFIVTSDESFEVGLFCSSLHQSTGEECTGLLCASLHQASRSVTDCFVHHYTKVLTRNVEREKKRISGWITDVVVIAVAKSVAVVAVWMGEWMKITYVVPKHLVTKERMLTMPAVNTDAATS